VSTNFDTAHIQEPVPSTTATHTFGHHPVPASGSFHKVAFTRSSSSSGGGNGVFPKGDNAGTNTFGWRFSEVNIVRDEQGNNVTFASKNHPVLGGGLVHVVTAVSAG
jgi:hypothetical protein